MRPNSLLRSNSHLRFNSLLKFNSLLLQSLRLHCPSRRPSLLNRTLFSPSFSVVRPKPVPPLSVMQWLSMGWLLMPWLLMPWQWCSLLMRIEPEMRW